MIRAAFLIEHSGEQLSCMLNPAELVFRRAAGVGRRRALGGPFTAGRSPDEPLLYNGGGTTELVLDLVFDVSIPGSTQRTEDVRDLTRPLWRLAENADLDGGLVRPPTVRFVWGKAWNFPGVVCAVAERFDQFEASGIPRRSWLRLKMLRVDDRAAPAAGPARPDPEAVPPLIEGEPPPLGDFPLPDDTADRLAAAGGGFRRLDLEAYWSEGNPGAWRKYARAIGAIDPLSVPAVRALVDRGIS